MNLSLLTNLGDSRWFTAGLGGTAFAALDVASSRLVMGGWGGSAEHLITQGLGDFGGSVTSSSVNSSLSLLTSLGDSRWFTRGYGSGLPAAPLVIQGLGPAGGHLLIQGYGPASSAGQPTTAVIGIRYGGSAKITSILHSIFMNDGLGGRINYELPIAVVGGTSWTSPPLSFPGSYKFAVRVRDFETGREEQNVDAVVSLVLDALGRDVTAVPSAPLGGRAFGLPGARLRVEWSCPCLDPNRRPQGFNLYVDDGSAGDHSQPVAVVPWCGDVAGNHSATLSNLTSGNTCRINIRAFNSRGEEPIGLTVVAAADITPPTLVDGLSATAADRSS